MNNVNYKPAVKSILEVLMDSEPQYPYGQNKEQQLNKNVKYRVLESDEMYLLELHCAGYQKADFDVSVEKDQLIVTTKSNSDVPDGFQMINSNIPNGNIYKIFKLNDQVDKMQITAKYENGVMSITLPKDAKLAASMKIVIN